MASEITWKRAIEKVLSSSSTPLHYREISEKIISEGFRESLGATPAATVNAQISASIKHEKDASPYIRVAKGTFAMRNIGFSGSTAVAQKLAPDISESDESEEQYEIVTSFGMFWRRESVEWRAKPKILGMQQIGADSVNFFNQLGIYLLYDGREVIYVGRTTERPLGKQLYAHTLDRLSARWNRFSWCNYSGLIL